jgi:hypothetical protein
MLADLPVTMPALPPHRRIPTSSFGNVHSPWSRADPRELLHYTTHAQVASRRSTSPRACARAMREFQPDVLLCAPGPGASLRAPVGHTVLRG